jgi:hypothetical protein
MNKTLPDVIADVLTYHGAVVEKTAEDCLEVVVPPEIAPILNVSEYVRLSFPYGGTCEYAVSATFDSKFFGSLGKLFANVGKFASVHLEPSLPNIEKTARIVNERLVFQNAVFRPDRVEISDISYLLVCLKYTALSDEKHEGIVPVLINGLNLSTTPLESAFGQVLENLRELDSSADKEQYVENHIRKNPALTLGSEALAKTFHAACAAGIKIVLERQQEFIKSLNRRLNRDVKRVFEYYGALKGEIDRKREGVEGSDGKTDALINKLNAIEAERKGKIQDLIAKYALNIRIEPLTAVAIETRGPLFWITIKRRLAARRFPVTYNTVVRGLDALPCESCFHPRGGYCVCDDKLHIVCSECFTPCPSCGRQYCKACHKDRCPKCKRNFERY